MSDPTKNKFQLDVDNSKALACYGWTVYCISLRHEGLPEEDVVEFEDLPESRQIAWTNATHAMFEEWYNTLFCDAIKNDEIMRRALAVLKFGVEAGKKGKLGPEDSFRRAVGSAVLDILGVDDRLAKSTPGPKPSMN